MQAFDLELVDEELLAAMEPDERARVLELLEAQYGVEPLTGYINRNYPAEPVQQHMAPIVDAIERSRHERVFAAFSMPPRHGKTVTISRGLSWLMGTSPADLNGYVTYSSTKARSKARPIRALARMNGVQLDPTSQSLEEMRTLEGGGLISVGADAGLTGVGISGVLVFDDPYANRKDAESAIVRENIWDIFSDVVFTRLEKGSVIIIHTRWHEDDLIGRLFDQHVEGKLSKFFPWEFYNLAALAEPGDYLGREVGAPLWPERFSEEELRAIEFNNPWSFAALYQGHPRPRGAQCFGEPGWYDPKTLDLTGMRIFIGADPAATDSEQSDHSVAVALAVKGTGRQRVCYVLEVMRGHWTIPEFARRLRAMQLKWWGAPVAVEAVSAFKAIPQILHAQDPTLRVTEAPVLGDKWQRAQPAAAMWNDGRILLPTGGYPWVIPFKKVVRAFTGINDPQDDDVDALAHTVNSIEFTPLPPKRGAVANSRRWR